MPAGAVIDDTEQAVLLAGLEPGTARSTPVSWPGPWSAGSTTWPNAALDLLGPSTKRAGHRRPGGHAARGRLGAASGTGTEQQRAHRPVGIAVPLDLPGRRPPRIRDQPDPATNPDLATTSNGFQSSLSTDIEKLATRPWPGRWTKTAQLPRPPAVSAGEISRSKACCCCGAGRADRGGTAAGWRVLDVAARIEWAVHLGGGLTAQAVAELIYTLVGTRPATQESVPAAFAVPLLPAADPWRACLLAASLGGRPRHHRRDGRMAIAGACAGVEAFPPERSQSSYRPRPQ